MTAAEESMESRWLISVWVGGPWHGDAKLTKVTWDTGPDDRSEPLYALRGLGPYTGRLPLPIERYGNPESPLDCPVVWEGGSFLIHADLAGPVAEFCGDAIELLPTEPVAVSMPIENPFVAVHVLGEVDVLDPELAQWRLHGPETGNPDGIYVIDAWVFRDDLVDLPPIFRVAHDGPVVITPALRTFLETLGPNFAYYWPMPYAADVRAGRANPG